ncbi:MAG: Amuc_1100 family pilus-like protein [Verrucomicrobiae bacterium]|nr:Amuc_1100 family pilus-like protein [Verrucomicrobiae bacterium]MDW8309360.1 Amuc_1100 family pilus-like protein [Verrucomicrobiales bacterium]
MDWIKRNPLFVVGAVIAVALLGVAGWYSFSRWSRNAAAREELNKAYEELKRLQSLPIASGSAKVDNIRLAREQQQRLQTVLAAATQYFQPPAPVPDSPNPSDGEFAAALRRTVDQLTREANSASVLLPADFKFSFSQQFRQLSFAPGSVPALAAQLGEVRAICNVLIRAKVNSLDMLQRVRVSPDDLQGPVTDYLQAHPQTNDLGVLTPYQIVFRAFSAELAQVISGFANAPHGFIVHTLQVEPASALPVEPTETPTAPPVTYVTPTPVPVVPRYPSPLAAEQAEARERAALRPDLYGRAGVPPGRYPQPPAYTPPVVTAPAAPGAPAARPGPQIVLDERPLQVTMLVEVVKLHPQK